MLQFPYIDRQICDVFLTNILNCETTNINFTIEHEQNRQIAFLDTLVSRNNCSIFIDVYQQTYSY